MTSRSGNLILLGTIPLMIFFGCKGSRESDAGGEVLRVVQVGSFLNELGHRDLAKDVVVEAMGENLPGKTSHALNLASFFRQIGEKEISRKWETEAVLLTGLRSPSGDLIRLEELGILTLPQKWLDEWEERLAGLSASEVLWLSRVHHMRFDPGKASGICREAARDRSGEERTFLLENALEYARSGHDLKAFEEISRELGDRWTSPTSDGLSVLRKEGRKIWKIDLLDPAVGWNESKGEFSKDQGEDSGIGAAVGSRSLGVWVRGNDAWLLLSKQTITETPSFTLSGKVKIHAVPWDGFFRITFWKDKPETMGLGTGPQEALRKRMEEDPDFFAAITFASHFGTRTRPVTDGSAIPGYIGTGGLSYGTSRDVGLLARVGEERRGPPLASSGNRYFQFEYGREYSFRLSQWRPLRELYFEVAEVGGSARWAYTRKDFHFDPTEPFWICLFLVTGEIKDPLENLISVEIEDLRLQSPIENLP